jgi:branched-chain amino acid transport system permease protein
MKILGLVLLCIGAIVAPYYVYPVVLMKWLALSIFACAVNLPLGRAGLLSVGHAAFFGTGAYAAGYALKHWGFTPELAMLLACVCSGILGVIFGAIAIRRRGIYFSMITLALAQMLFFIFLKAPFTGGEDGLQSIPRGKLFGLIDLSDDMTLYWTMITITILAAFAIWRTSKSPFGQTFRAIGNHEARARSLGIPANNLKHLAFSISASIAGLAGAMKAIIFQVAALNDAHWSLSGEGILMCLLGGMGSIFGPSLGAAVVIFIENGLAERAGPMIGLIMGVTFMICTLLFRQGFAGALKKIKF